MTQEKRIGLKKKKIVKIINYLIFFIYFISPLFFYGMTRLEKYTNWFTISAFLVLIGIILGTIVTKIVGLKYNKLIEYKPNRKGLAFKPVVIVLCVILSFSLGIIVNEEFSYKTENINYKIERVSLKSFGRESPSYVFIINSNNKVERLQFGKRFIEKIQFKDSVNLNINHGLLGISYYTIPEKVEVD